MPIPLVFFNISVNTALYITLNTFFFVHMQELTGEAIKYFSKKLLAHEIFSLIAVFFEKI